MMLISHAYLPGWDDLHDLHDLDMFSRVQSVRMIYYLRDLRLGTAACIRCSSCRG